MIPTVPGVCLFCLMGVPHPVDVSELLLHEIPGEPTDEAEE
jgi:hypothetical protein